MALVKYAVMFKLFYGEDMEYVRQGCGSMWTNDSPIKTFDTKEQAEEELKKWKTGVVVEYGYDEPDFKME